MNNFFRPFLFKIKYAFSELAEFFKVCLRFYKTPRFLVIDLLFFTFYFFSNPYRICRRFFEENPCDEKQFYGETPLTTWVEIAEKADLGEKDWVYELGCGRGKGVFWLHCLKGCRVTGIDLNPVFIQKAIKINKIFKWPDVQFIEKNMLNADFKDATAIYLYGTSLSNNSIAQLAKRFEPLPSGTKIITVSFPLTGFTQKPLFKPTAQFKGNFLWGEADIYVQIKI